ncbi:MAG: epoxyqueuosine reductase QueH [Candidatus Margulisiibacteriota bacterium]
MSIVNPIGNTVLLHVCCGVCLGWPVHKLRDEGYCVVGYFFNPNISSQEEYSKRLSAAKKISKALELELINVEYCHDKWLKAVTGLEGEKEGGYRCGICFQMRLEETYRKAGELGLNKFATTLTVSSHKDFNVISKIGKGINGKKYLAFDFKKEDGFKKTRDLARQNDLYCQNYCGCEFSIR